MVQVYTAQEVMGALYRANCLAHARKYLDDYSKPIWYIDGRYYVDTNPTGTAIIESLDTYKHDITLFTSNQIEIEDMKELLFMISELHLTESSENNAMCGLNVKCKLYLVEGLGYVLCSEDYPITDDYDETNLEEWVNLSAFSEVIVTLHEMLRVPPVQ